MANEVTTPKENTNWNDDKKRLGDAELTLNGKPSTPDNIPKRIQQAYSQEFFIPVTSSLPTLLVDAGYSLVNPTLTALHFKTNSGKAASTRGRSSPTNPKIQLEIVASFDEVMYAPSAESTKINLPGTIALHFEQFQLNDAKNYRFKLKQKVFDDDYQKTTNALKALVQLRSAIKRNGCISSGLITLRESLKAIAKNILEIVENDTDDLIAYTELLTDTKSMQSCLLDKDVRKKFAAALNTLDSETFHEIHYQYAQALLKYEISKNKKKPALQNHAKTILADFEDIHTKGLISTQICTNVLEQTASLLDDPDDETRQVDFANALQEVAALDDRRISAATGSMVFMLGSAALATTAGVAIVATSGIAGLGGLGIATTLKLLKIYAAKHVLGNSIGAAATVVSSALSSYGLFPDPAIRKADATLHKMQDEAASLSNQ